MLLSGGCYTLIVVDHVPCYSCEVRYRTVLDTGIRHFCPLFYGDGVKIYPPGDRFDQTSGGVSCI